MKTYQEIKYHIEVEHEPGTFKNDMDFLTFDSKAAYKKFQDLKEKYSSNKVTITKIKETKAYGNISESDLEQIITSL